MRFIFALPALLPIIGAGIIAQTGSSQVQTHVSTLQTGNTLNVVMTVQKVGGSAEEQTLLMSRDNLLKWESSTSAVYSDGKQLVEYDKTTKSYSEQPFTAEAFQKLAQKNPIFIWCAFANKDFANLIGPARLGSNRNIKGNPVREIAATLKADPTLTYTFYYDEKIKAFRGGLIHKEGDSADLIVNAAKIEISADKTGADAFTFVAPADAKKVSPGATATILATFKEVKQILTAPCASCHIHDRKGGYLMDTYDNILKGGRSGAAVIPGNSAGSPLIMHLRGQRKQMPMFAPKLPEQAIQKVAGWIDAGAKYD